MSKSNSSGHKIPRSPLGRKTTLAKIIKANVNRLTKKGVPRNG